MSSTRRPARTGAPASAQCGSTSITASAPARRSPAAGCGGRGGRSKATRTVPSSARFCCARRRWRTAPATLDVAAALSRAGCRPRPPVAPRRPGSRGAADARPSADRPGPASRRPCPARRGDAVRPRRPPFAVLDRQGVLQSDQRVRAAGRPRAGRGVDRRHGPLGRAAPVRGLPRLVPCAPRHHVAMARTVG